MAHASISQCSLKNQRIGCGVWGGERESVDVITVWQVQNLEDGLADRKHTQSQCCSSSPKAMCCRFSPNQSPVFKVLAFGWDEAYYLH